MRGLFYALAICLPLLASCVSPETTLPPPAQSTAPAPAALAVADFPRANTTWGARLNPSGELPESGYMAYYFDRSEDSPEILREHVDAVGINYIRDDFHGIGSENFAAYWVGTLDIPEAGIQDIAISQSWAKARVIIDGAVVHEGGGDKQLSLYLGKGQHRVEVEYINNWHTTEFAVTFLDSVPALSFQAIDEQLRQSIPSGYHAQYVGVYESSARDMSLQVNVAAASDPVILFLSSYSPVKWRIANPHGNDIRAVVYSSHKPGSTVTGRGVDHARLYLSEERIGSYREANRCRCSAASFRCERSGVLATKTEIEKLTGASLTGFSGQYEAAVIDAPRIAVDPALVEQLQAEERKIEQQRKACRRKTDPDFEGMFDTKS